MSTPLLRLVLTTLRLALALVLALQSVPALAADVRTSIQFRVGAVEGGLAVYGVEVARRGGSSELRIPSEFNDASAVLWQGDDPPESFDGMKVVAVGGEDVEFDYATQKIEDFPVGRGVWGNFRKIVVPEGVEKIGSSAFEGSEQLQEIELPSTVKLIDDFAFAECKALQRVVVPEGCEVIESAAFYRCESLKSVALPSTLLFIRDGAFYQCEELVEINLPEGLKIIDDEAFLGCARIAEAIIPEGVERIGAAAFQRCAALRVVKLPASLEVMSGFNRDPDEDADESPCPFHECRNIESFEVAPKNKYFLSLDGVLFTRDKKVLLRRPPMKTDSKYVVPASVTKIDAYAFEGCDDLEEIVLPNNLVEIGAYAFASCGDLKELVLPKKLEKLGEGAFARCASLEKVALPKGVKKIGAKTFFYCRALKEVALPAKLDAIGYGAFAWCASLEKIALPEGVKEIPDQAFYRCGALKEVALPKSVESIDANAFRSCDAPLLVRDATYAQRWAEENGRKFELVPEPESGDVKAKGDK